MKARIMRMNCSTAPAERPRPKPDAFSAMSHSVQSFSSASTVMRSMVVLPMPRAG